MLKRAFLTAIMSLFLGLMPVALLSNPASAASSDGAQHTHSEFCDEFTCVIADSVGNITVTGNVVSLIGVIDFTFTYDNGTCQFDEHQKVTQHEVAKLADQTIQVMTFRSRDIVIQSGEGLPCNPPPTNCIITTHIAFANGEYRDTTVEVDCTTA